MNGKKIRNILKKKEKEKKKGGRIKGEGGGGNFDFSREIHVDNLVPVQSPALGLPKGPQTLCRLLASKSAAWTPSALCLESGACDAPGVSSPGTNPWIQKDS